MFSATSAHVSSDNQADFADLVQRATISVIHEVTLQDLLRCSNNAVYQLLLECNTLLQEHISLSTAAIDYSNVDFLSPLPPILPYIIVDGHVLRFQSKQNQGCRRPADVSSWLQFDFCTTNITTEMLFRCECTDRQFWCHSHRIQPWCSHRAPYCTRPWLWYQEKEKRMSRLLIRCSYNHPWKVAQSIAMS